MKHPYQCIRSLPSGERVVAACGPDLLVLGVQDAEISCKWSPNEQEENDAEKDSSPEIKLDEPPRKRRKTIQNANASSITDIITTSSGGHVIVTTGEDKSVLVFGLATTGQLQLQSKRQMPKRPCALALTPDDETILIGDKFGDVYGLPLIPPESDSAPKAEAQEQQKSIPRPFKPSATDLTVHTGRNRKALEAQMKQSPVPPSQKEPTVLTFAHELLLGHVSMLTAIACVPVSQSLPDGGTNQRTYIITADRDEHIRVSRGPPQSHIIDSYCFGHTSFVSSLCILPAIDNKILVSGGGDNFLAVWDWQQSALLGKIDLRAALAKFWETQPVRQRRDKKTQAQTANDEALLLQDAREAVGKAEQSTNPEELVDEQAEDEVEEKLVVADIWAVSGRRKGDVRTTVICALEGVPALFHFLLSAQDTQTFDQSSIDVSVTPLAGNPLDVAVVSNEAGLLVSIDSLHKPGTIDELRSGTSHNHAVPRVQYIELGSNQDLSATSAIVKVLNEGTADTSADEKELKAVRELLYPNANLRKRAGEES